MSGGTVVIGLGSPLMGDDGLGLHALEALSRSRAFDPEPLFVDGGTWGMNLLPIIESAERLLLVDAIRAGGTPGELVVIERDGLVQEPEAHRAACAKEIDARQRAVDLDYPSRQAQAHDRLLSIYASVADRVRRQRGRSQRARVPRW